jgi:glycerol uptake facilitator protein
MNKLLGECIAEALGTFIIVVFGTASVAMVKLFGTGVPGEVVNGGFTNITIAWGLAVTFGIYVSARVSGAHLNPAVTLPLAVYRRFPWSKVGPYCLAQTIGAFVAAALVFLVYRTAFLKVDPSLNSTAGVFTTFPAFPDYPAVGLLDQVVGTFLLVLLIFALSDDWNMPVAGNLGPVLVGLVVVAIGMTFGSLHGYAINPARDFGPRVLTVLAGFRNNGLTDGSRVWLVPIAGPLVGGLLGGLAWDQLIHRHLEPPE